VKVLEKTRSDSQRPYVQLQKARLEVQLNPWLDTIIVEAINIGAGPAFSIDVVAWVIPSPSHPISAHEIFRNAQGLAPGSHHFAGTHAGLGAQTAGTTSSFRLWLSPGISLQGIGDLKEGRWGLCYRCTFKDVFGHPYDTFLDNAYVPLDTRVLWPSPPPMELKL